MARLAEEPIQSPEPARERPPELIRGAAERRTFPAREAQRHLKQKERPWAPIAYGVFFVAVLVIFGAAYTSYAFSRYRGQILPSVYVDQTSLGGLTAKQAENVIDKQLAAIYFVPVRMTYGKQSWVPNKGDIGLGYRVPETVREAMAVGRHESFPQQLIDRLPFHPAHAVPLLYRIDQTRLSNYIQSIATSLHKKVVNANLTIAKDQVALIHSRPGKQLDVHAAEHAVQASLGSLSKQTIPLKVDPIVPEITDADAIRYSKRVERFLAKPPVIGAGTAVVVTTRADFAPMLSFHQQTSKSSASIIMVVDPVKVKAYIARLAAQVDRAPANAKMAFNAGHVQLLSAKRNGRTLDQQDAYSKLLPAITSLRPNARLHFKVSVTKPQIELSNPASLGINTLLATAETSFAGASTARLNDIMNISRVLDNDLLPPNQDVSFNTLVGSGWSSTVYSDQETQSGSQLVPGDGGAMQQVATTFLRALYGTGLKLLERHAHNYRLSWYEPPVGLDAVVAPDRGWDLRFHNNTGKYLLIQTTVQPVQQKLYIYVYGPKLGWNVSVDRLGKILKTYKHGPTIVRQDPTLLPGETRQVAWPHDGADVVVQRTITFPDGRVQTDQIHTTYQPWQGIVYTGSGTSNGKNKLKSSNPSPKPTPTFSH